MAREINSPTDLAVLTELTGEETDDAPQGMKKSRNGCFAENRVIPKAAAFRDFLQSLTNLI
ncbi:MAG: hypothetical protein ACLR56_04935 [Oscillospiraceae bacterium]